MNIEHFFLEGLGHQSYLVTDEQNGMAAVIDPRRDVDVYLQAASHAGVRITHILETHVHNDYVTGARELAERTGATIVASAGDPLAYEHMPVRDGDRFPVGRASFQVLATPGHTPHHVSYVLYEPESETPGAVFSGGSLLVGSAGRTDLLGEGMTLTLTHQQYHTLRRLLDTLPGQVRVYPTHGAGSFCVAGAVSTARSTTIAQERLVNPAFLARDEAEFVRKQIAGYIAYPKYYRYMHDINKGGPRILGSLPVLPPLAPRTVQERLGRGIPLLDGRSRDVFAREHVPGSFNIELDSQFGTYVGWLLPFNVPLMLLIEDEEGRREAVVQLIRIGYEQIEGYLDGGIASWKAAALPVEQFELIDVNTLHQRLAGQESLTVVDVRRDDEWREGHLPDALHLHLGDLPQHLDEVPRDRPVATMCRSGQRAEIAASMIAATGRQVIAVGKGGVPDWMDRDWPSTVEETVRPGSHHDQTT
jgi:hydroxyacylglutathione hydrolase